MENASKALLMAGGVLISLLVIGALVLMFGNLQDYQIKINASIDQEEIAKFNNEFEPYNKKDVTLTELKSVYNKIMNNNALHPEYEIETNIKRSVYSNIEEQFEKIPEDDKINMRFECTEILYENDGGRISQMNFIEK